MNPVDQLEIVGDQLEEVTGQLEKALERVGLLEEAMGNAEKKLSTLDVDPVAANEADKEAVKETEALKTRLNRLEAQAVGDDRKLGFQETLTARIKRLEEDVFFGTPDSDDAPKKSDRGWWLLLAGLVMTAVVIFAAQ